jgi:UDP-glucose:(heptosyl)LPS alpha-1,3-glucosyltransferase
MNIALVILHANPALGGAEGYTVNLARALIGRGHTVSLLATTFAADLPPARQVPIASRGLTRLGRYLCFLDALDEHLKSERYDIVHAMLPVRRCHAYHPHAGLAFEGVELGHLRHNDPLKQTVARWGNRLNRKRRQFAAVERQMLSGSQPPVVLCLTDSMRAAASRRFPVIDGQIVKLFYGIDLGRFDPTVRPDAGAEQRTRLRLSPQDIVALIVAQDFERKGVPEAIRVVAAVNDPRLKLVVVGRDNPAPMQRLAARLGVTDRIILAGPTADVHSFFKASHFMLFPARVDPCPFVVLESVAMGVPVIVTRQAGSHEIITSGQNGFVIDHPTNVPAMTEAARNLLDPALRAKMSEACLQIRSSLSFDHHLDRLIQIYEKCMVR